jgi:hypothetical protein
MFFSLFILFFFCYIFISSFSALLYSTSFDTHADWTSGFYQSQNQLNPFYFRWSNATNSWATSSLTNDSVFASSYLFLQSPPIDLSTAGIHFFVSSSILFLFHLSSFMIYIFFLSFGISDPTKLQVLEARIRLDLPAPNAGVNFQYSCNISVAHSLISFLYCLFLFSFFFSLLTIVNGGPFRTVLSSSPSNGWYSSSVITDFLSAGNFLSDFSYGWSSSSNGQFTTVNTTLPQFSAHSFVVFRLNFVSSATSATNYGVFFDSFNIYEISDVSVPYCVVRNLPIILDSTGLLSWSKNASEPIGII